MSVVMQIDNSVGDLNRIQFEVTSIQIQNVKVQCLGDVSQNRRRNKSNQKMLSKNSYGCQFDNYTRHSQGKTKHTEIIASRKRRKRLIFFFIFSRRFSLLEIFYFRNVSDDSFVHECVRVNGRLSNRYDVRSFHFVSSHIHFVRFCCFL